MTILTIPVAASADDVSAQNTSFFWDNVNDTAVGYPFGYGTGVRESAWRFLNVTVPQGATINSAKITGVSRDGRTSTVVNSHIQAEDVDDATQITSATDFQNRTLTTASVDWNNIPGWTQGVAYDSPDIASVIQEVVNRANWSSGNAINIFWKNDTTDEAGRVIASYDHATYDPPELEIDYTAAVTINPDQWLPRYPSQYDYKNAIASY